MGPNDLNYVTAPRKLVEAIDSLIEVAKHNGSKDQVQSEKDWATIKFIYKMFSALYPYQEKLFTEAVNFYRSFESVNKGVSKDKGGASVQHQLEVPQKFYQMVKIIFSTQVWDKKFVSRLSKELPQFKTNNARV